MSDTWKVKVEGGGDDLFKIWKYADKYRVYKMEFRYIGGNGEDFIGEEDTLPEALLLITNTSGEDIESIEEED